MTKIKSLSLSLSLSLYYSFLRRSELKGVNTKWLEAAEKRGTCNAQLEMFASDYEVTHFGIQA